MAKNKKVEEKESEFKELYGGKELSVTEDDDFVTLYFGLTSIGIPKDNEDWKNLRKDIIKFASILTKK